MKQREIIYEPHPVTPERKAELVAKGYKIIDAVYAPAEVKEPITRETIDKMARKDVIDLLELHGVERATGKIADLRNWLKRAMFADL